MKKTVKRWCKKYDINWYGQGSNTEIHSDFIYHSEEDLKKLILKGMKEGLEMACQNLDLRLHEFKSNRSD